MRKTEYGPAGTSLEQKLRRREEPTMEDILAVIAEMRDMLVPPDWCAGDEVSDSTSRAPSAASVEEFERNVLSEAVDELRADLEAIHAAHNEVLSDMVLDAYWRIEEARALEPENAELAGYEKKMREILEKGLGRPVPTREEWEAERQWEEEEPPTERYST